MGKLGEPGRHKTTHQDDGSDEISVEALSGLLADDQHVLDTEVLAVAIAKTLLTTKGDLMGYSTVLARLGIGTDTHVLTADSGEDTGMKWAAVAADGDGATVATGSYAGNDTERQITTGFQCSLVIFLCLSPEQVFILVPSATISHYDGSMSDRTAYIYLHATDGFYFTREYGNTTGRTYYYWAISE